MSEIPRPGTGIQVRSLRYTPPGAAHEALAGVSLDLRPGEFVAVLGHNGSGKSTLARHIAGLLTPQSGEIRIDGLSTDDPASLPALRRLVGLVFQNPDHQIVGASVSEDVLWGMPAGLDAATARERMLSTLFDVGLQGYESQPTWRLSGGQKQRLALAGVLARGPRYLVCDEPTALLDGRSREEARRLLLRCRANGLGLLWITHRLEEALPADRMLMLAAGTIVAEGSPSEVAAALGGAAIALPPLARLAEQLREAGFPLRGIAGTADELAQEIATVLDEARAVAGGKRSTP